MSFQTHGNVCLGILDGTQIGLGNVNVIGGKIFHIPIKYKESVFSLPFECVNLIVIHVLLL